MVSNDPFISDEIGGGEGGECRDAQRGRQAGPVSSAIFIMVITEYSMGLTPRLFSSYTSGSYVKFQKR